jgi:hypothetical protein
MTLAAHPAQTAWSELGVERHGWVVSGVFSVNGSAYEAQFTNEAELSRFLDFLLASPVKPATSRLYLHPHEIPARPEHQVSNLRFQFDPEHQVAAAVLLVIDRAHNNVLSWRTLGNAGYPDVVLAHDSWNEHETLFPPDSHITLPELRHVVTAWAFGDRLPPQAVKWVDAAGVDWL